MTAKLSGLHANLLACVFSYLTPKDLAKNQTSFLAMCQNVETLFKAMLKNHTTLTCPEGTQNCLEEYLIIQMYLERRESRQHGGQPGPFNINVIRSVYSSLFNQMPALTHLTLVDHGLVNYIDANHSVSIASALCAHLKGGSKITSLEVQPYFAGHSRIGPFITQILDAGTNLTALSFPCKGVRSIDDEAISQLVSKCQKLETLTIHAGQITDQSLHLLPRLLALRTLNLHGCEQITAKGLERLRFNTPVQVSCLPAPKE